MRIQTTHKSYIPPLFLYLFVGGGKNGGGGKGRGFWRLTGRAREWQRKVNYAVCAW